MITIDIPGYKTLKLAHLVMDYNGTMACDGELIVGVKEMLDALAGDIDIHVVTADTFGKAAGELADTPAKLSVLSERAQDGAKQAYIQALDASTVVAVGNGRNDKLMLQTAELGIALIQKEGACVETVMAADIACPDILSALSLLTTPKRLIAGLRQ